MSKSKREILDELADHASKLDTIKEFIEGIQFKRTDDAEKYYVVLQDMALQYKELNKLENQHKALLPEARYRPATIKTGNVQKRIHQQIEAIDQQRSLLNDKLRIVALFFELNNRDGQVAGTPRVRFLDLFDKINAKLTFKHLDIKERLSSIVSTTRNDQMVLELGIDSGEDLQMDIFKEQIKELKEENQLLQARTEEIIGGLTRKIEALTAQVEALTTRSKKEPSSSFFKAGP